MESTRDREKKHGTRLVPCTRLVLFRVVEIRRTPAEGPPLSTPSPHPITTPLNGFKRPRRRQWGRHATGLANLPHQLAKKFLIYRPTDFYLPPPPPWRRVERGSRRKKVEESCPRYTRWRDVWFCESLKCDGGRGGSLGGMEGEGVGFEMKKLERLLIFVYF